MNSHKRMKAFRLEPQTIEQLGKLKEWTGKDSTYWVQAGVNIAFAGQAMLHFRIDNRNLNCNTKESQGATKKPVSLPVEAHENEARLPSEKQGGKVNA